jgi:hypothetical protein
MTFPTLDQVEALSPEEVATLPAEALAQLVEEARSLTARMARVCQIVTLAQCIRMDAPDGGASLEVRQ